METLEGTYGYFHAKFGASSLENERVMLILVK